MKARNIIWPVLAIIAGFFIGALCCLSPFAVPQATQARIKVENDTVNDIAGMAPSPSSVSSTGYVPFSMSENRCDVIFIPGTQVAWFRDPDGNTISVTQLP
jgi:hypothetical protein